MPDSLLFDARKKSENKFDFARFFPYVVSMEKITVGTEILVFTIGWLKVEEIDSSTGLLWCIDQDGGDHEIAQGQVDSIISEAELEMAQADLIEDQGLSQG
mgnify:CR=1 FL=1